MSRVRLDSLIRSDESGFACSKTKLVESGLPHLRPFNISSDGRLDFSEVYQVPESEAPLGRTYLEAGDILFNNTNSAELVGKSALVQYAMRAGFSNHLNRIRLDRSQIEPAFLAFWLQRVRNTGLFTAQATQWVSQAAYKMSEMRQLEIDLPPLPEQRRIVDVLSRAEGIVRLRREAEQKTAEIIPALFLDMFGDTATNPKGWAVQPLHSLVSFQSGGTPSKTREDFWEGDLPWVSPKDMKRMGIADAIDHINRKVLTETNIKLVPIGALLIVVRGMILVHTVPVARALVPLTINQDMKALMPTGESIGTTYLLWLLKVSQTRLLDLVATAAHGTKKLETRLLESFLIPVPPKKMQEIFGAHVAKVESIQYQQSAATAKAQATFDALLAQAFSD